jgi:hypothetical protein
MDFDHFVVNQPKSLGLQERVIQSVPKHVHTLDNLHINRDRVIVFLH